MKHIPLRSCIVCRRQKDKSELLRIVRQPDGAVVIDATGKPAGRGATACKRRLKNARSTAHTNSRCPTKCIRSLKRLTKVSMRTNKEQGDKFLTMVGFAKRAGAIVLGYDSLRTAKGVRLIAVSDTASDNLKGDMERLADKRNIPIVYAPTLEDKVGGNVKALGITNSDMSRAITDYVSDGATQYGIRLGTRR